MISFDAVTVYDIAHLTKLFTIYSVNGHILTANICAWLPFSSPFLGAIGDLTSANLPSCLLFQGLVTLLLFQIFLKNHSQFSGVWKLYTE